MKGFIRRNDLLAIEKWKNHFIDTQIDTTIYQRRYLILKHQMK